MWRIAILVCCLITPASAADIQMSDCRPAEFIWQKRTIKQIDKDNFLMLDDSSCYQAAGDIVQHWQVGDEVLVVQFRDELINQSRGNEGVNVVTDAGD